MSRGGGTLRRPRMRRRSRERAGGHASTGGRNTQSLNSTVRVHYRFHPLHERDLEVVYTPRAVDGTATVVDPTGRRLKIPAWMLSPEAGELRLSEQPLASARALLKLAGLLAPRLAAPEGDATSDSLAPKTKGKTAERRRTRGTASTGRRARRAKGRAASSDPRAGARAKGSGGRVDRAGATARTRGTRRRR
jgi:hypothetical protein